MANTAIYGPNRTLNNSLTGRVLNLTRRTVNENFVLNVLKNMNTRGSKNYVVLNENGRLLGFSIIRNKNTTMHLNLIGANKGYGRQLMERMIQNARRRGIKKIVLFSVPHAVNFYRKFGFLLKNQYGQMTLNLGNRKRPRT